MRFENIMAKCIKCCFCLVFTAVFIIVVFVDKKAAAAVNSTLNTAVPNIVLDCCP